VKQLKKGSMVLMTIFDWRFYHIFTNSTNKCGRKSKYNQI
jgi:hypothetical protein